MPCSEQSLLIRPPCLSLLLNPVKFISVPCEGGPDGCPALVFKASDAALFVSAAIETSAMGESLSLHLVVCSSTAGSMID